MKRQTPQGLALLLALACNTAIAGTVAQNSQDKVNDEMTYAGNAVDSTTQGISCKDRDVIDGIAFAWCMDKRPTADRSKILYYLHGAGGNQRTLIGSAFYASLQQRWKAANVQPPVVIAVSFGPYWTLTDLPSNYVAGRPVLGDFLVQRVMPYLESSIAATNVVNKVGSATGVDSVRRFVMGTSMGGYNGALLLERRGTLFRKVVLGCPALFTSIDPFSAADEIDAYVARTGATLTRVSWGLGILGRDETALGVDDWNRNDPLAQAKLLTALSPQLLVWYNDHDDFGFQEGAAEYQSSAALLGVPVQPAFHNAGRHCEVDTALGDRLAAFLQ